MKFKVKAKTLESALGYVSGAVGSGINNIYENILVDVRGQDMELTGSDGMVQVSTTCQVSPSSAKSEAMFAVNAKKLVSIVSSILDKNSELELNFTGKNMSMKSSKGDFFSSLATRDANEFPVLVVDEDPGLVIRLQESELVRKLRRIEPSISKQTHRVFLMGAFFDFKDDRLNLVSTDGHRLAIDVIKATSKAEAGLIVPRKAVVEIIRLGNTESSLEVELRATRARGAPQHGNINLEAKGDDAVESFRNVEFVFPGDGEEKPRVSLRSLLVEGTFPNYERVIPDAKTNDKHIVFDRVPLIDGIRQASTVHDLQSTGTQTVKIVSKDGSSQVELFGAGTDANDRAEVEVDMTEQAGTNLECQVNSQYMLDMLNAFDESEKVDIAFKDGEHSMLCRSSDAESDLNYIVMPVK